MHSNTNENPKPKRERRKEMKEETKEAKTETVEVKKPWYKKTWVVVTGLALSHAAAVTVGYIIGKNVGGDEGGSGGNTDTI